MTSDLEIFCEDLACTSCFAKHEFYIHKRQLRQSVDTTKIISF